MTKVRVAILCLLSATVSWAQGSLTIKTKSPLCSGYVGRNYSCPIEASGGKTPYTWDITERKPTSNWPAINSRGVLKGKPKKKDSYTITVTVNDADGNCSSQPFTLIIGEKPLAISSSERLKDGYVDQTYADKLTTTGGIGNPQWSACASSSSPDWLQVDAQGNVSFQKGVSAGTYKFCAQVRDNRVPNNTILKKTFQIKIAEALATGPSSLPRGVILQPYPRTKIIGGFPPYTAVNPPPGMSLKHGAIAGTPTELGSSTIKLTDRNNKWISPTIAIGIAPPLYEFSKPLSDAIDSLTKTAPAPRRLSRKIAELKKLLQDDLDSRSLLCFEEETHQSDVDARTKELCSLKKSLDSWSYGDTQLATDIRQLFSAIDRRLSLLDAGNSDFCHGTWIGECFSRGIRMSLILRRDDNSRDWQWEVNEPAPVPLLIPVKSTLNHGLWIFTAGPSSVASIADPRIKASGQFRYNSNEGVPSFRGTLTIPADQPMESAIAP